MRFSWLIMVGILGLNACEKYELSRLSDKSNVVSVVIIGSGPAGCAAATYAARAGLDVVMFEGPLPGGQLTETGYVENWPGISRARGVDIMANQRKQAEDAGSCIKAESVVSVDTSQWPFEVKTDEGTVVNALTLIVATGSEPRKMNVEGERECWGQGVSACAVCDAPLYEDREVIVVGGGDSAVEQVIQLSPFAKKVTQLVRRDEMRASLVMQNRLSEIPHAYVEYNKVIKKIYGDDLGVCAVDIFDVLTGNVEHRLVNGVFLAIGHLPRTQIFEGKLELDVDGCIKLIGRSQCTSIPGIFAAGDVADGVYRQAGVAAGEGSKAERDAEHFLQHIGLTPTVIRSLRLGQRKIDGLQFYSHR